MTMPTNSEAVIARQHVEKGGLARGHRSDLAGYTGLTRRAITNSGLQRSGHRRVACRVTIMLISVRTPKSSK